MKLSLLIAALTLLPSLALADSGDVTCLDGRFGDHVEQGRPVGDAGTVFAAKKAVYWVDVANSGDPTQVTLVWSIDGNEVQRQSLDVGRSPHWHSWGIRPLGEAKKLDVQVLDAAGKLLKEDSLVPSGN